MELEKKGPGDVLPGPLNGINVWGKACDKLLEGRPVEQSCRAAGLPSWGGQRGLQQATKRAAPAVAHEIDVASPGGKRLLTRRLRLVLEIIGSKKERNGGATAAQACVGEESSVCNLSWGVHCTGCVAMTWPGLVVFLLGSAAARAFELSCCFIWRGSSTARPLRGETARPGLRFHPRRTAADQCFWREQRPGLQSHPNGMQAAARLITQSLAEEQAAQPDPPYPFWCAWRPSPALDPGNGMARWFSLFQWGASRRRAGGRCICRRFSCAARPWPSQ